MLTRQIEQDRHPRIRGVDAVAQPGDPACGVSHGPFDGAGGGVVYRDPVAAGFLGSLPDQRHAALAGAAVFVADREDAGGDRRRQRLPVARRGEARGGAGRRAGAVIGHADEHGVEQLPLARVRQPPAMQQEDRVGERRGIKAVTS